MSDFGSTTDDEAKTRVMKAEFTRLLERRIEAISGDPKQARGLVYELARIKLLDQFAGDEAGAQHALRTLEGAIHDLERSFAQFPAEAPKWQEASAAPESMSDEMYPNSGPPVSTSNPLQSLVGRPRLPVGVLATIVRVALVLLLVLGGSAAVIYWPRIQPQMTSLLRQAPSHTVPRPAAAPVEQAAEQAQPSQTDQPSGARSLPPPFPLPTTFGIFVLSEGQLQELKGLPGKVPDKRVAISAAISSPSQTSVPNGDVKFIVFRPDLPPDSSGLEVRVLAKVARAMGVDAAGKATMVPAGDSWVIRNISFAFKIGPVEDHPGMLIVQPENDGLVLTPGGYVLVYKGYAYDFTVAGEVTDPNQCVERFNATNGAFYSPCPPPRHRR